MKLEHYINGITVAEQRGEANPDIVSITFDSRKAGKGVMFVAMRGTKTDGHNYIDAAVRAGSPVIVCERAPEGNFPNTVFIRVNDTAETLGHLANIHYGNPAQQLQLVGVTGTNGKTTIATLLYRLAMEMGYKAGLCSTIANYIDGMMFETANTTPDALTLNSLIRQMVDAGCTYCFMEVSSHAVVQQRIGGLKFKGGIFTNLTHDHLDYHGTFDAYLKAKKMFFDNLGKDAFALVNVDDRNGRVMMQNTAAAQYTYSLREMADYRTKIIESIAEGMQLSIKGNEFWTPLIGAFNASNLTAVYGAAELLGWNTDEILVNLSKQTSVDGRFETIRAANGVTAIVDYAHTPDALKNVIEAINAIRKPGNRLLIVIGAGGDRDPLKRPAMAREAVEGGDLVILTADNPRSEDPEAIIDQMLTGISEANRYRVLCIANRREAIRAACLSAQSGDMVLIAGKGHETYQEVKGERKYFDDREVVRHHFSMVNELKNYTQA
ncbi:MAG: UDP-N-acetylmuramoyl-L-alanyl-D-glutamate--2,6-diaminopimelate ligase [Cytophagaceae bacterium]|jgi:UDP-N-acetylmuramoyl-L-alanyl-D-glutamate--2,6-diaminopimelate ligase|nr:UDP-N-acetylmuramoyl-L-alanyl-D-glutamate--2,6-diaminopimelate ligase [Cytophagaceae bacterium]